MPPFAASSCRDRTSEFTAITDRLQKQVGAARSSGARENGEVPFQPPPSAGGASARHSEFSKRAARIGLGIHSTSQKLQRLAQLAKKTSMFDDPAAEISELTGVIKQDIQAMNAAIADLQNLSAASLDGNKQSADHSHTVVDSLRTRLKDATKQFKDVLTLRTENLKSNQDRRKIFTATPEKPSPFAPRPGPTNGSQQPLLSGLQSGNTRTAQALFGGSSGIKGSLQGGEASTSGGSELGPSSERSPLMQQQQMVAQQDTYYSSRAEALQNVESTIVELGGIFQQLAHMVAEQGEMAVRIDENIDDTLSNVESAQTQLLKYLNSISSNRWLLMKIFFVLMIFLIIFIFIA